MNVCLSGCAGVPAHLLYAYFWSCHPIPKPPTSFPEGCWVNTLWSGECTDTPKTFCKGANSLLSSNLKPLHLLCVCCMCVWAYVCDLHSITLANSRLSISPHYLHAVARPTSPTLSELSWKPNRDVVKAMFLSFCLWLPVLKPVCCVQHGACANRCWILWLHSLRREQWWRIWGNFLFFSCLNKSAAVLHAQI